MLDEGYQGNGSVVWGEHGEVLGDDGREIMADELYTLCKSLTVLAFTWNGSEAIGVSD